jgi:hypothetical protein
MQEKSPKLKYKIKQRISIDGRMVRGNPQGPAEELKITEQAFRIANREARKY